MEIAKKVILLKAGSAIKRGKGVGVKALAIKKKITFFGTIFFIFCLNFLPKYKLLLRAYVIDIRVVHNE